MSLDWDLVNYDMNISPPQNAGWTYGDGGLGNPSTLYGQTFDSRSVTKCSIDDGTTPQNYPNGAYTYSLPSPFGPPSFINATVTDYTIEAVIYIDKMDNTSYFRLSVNDSSTPTQYLNLRIYYNKLRLNTVSGGVQSFVYADFNVPFDSWMTIRCLKKNNLISVWINNQLYFYNIPADNTTTVTANIIFLTLSGGGIVYFDSCKVDSTAEQITDSILTINSEKIVTRYQQRTNDATYPNGVEKLNIYNSNQIRSIPLVATTDANASTVRIYDGTTVKSLMKLPT